MWLIWVQYSLTPFLHKWIKYKCTFGLCVCVQYIIKSGHCALSMLYCDTWKTRGLFNSKLALQAELVYLSNWLCPHKCCMLAVQTHTLNLGINCNNLFSVCSLLRLFCCCRKCSLFLLTVSVYPRSAVTTRENRKKGSETSERAWSYLNQLKGMVIFKPGLNMKNSHVSLGSLDRHSNALMVNPVHTTYA